MWKPLPLLSERNNAALITVGNICYGKRFYNDFFSNHSTIALVHNCLKLLSCVVIEQDCSGRNENKSIILTVFQLENVPFNIKSYRFECNDSNAC